MKTIRTIATVILAAFLVLGPVVAYGAGATMAISTNAPPGGYSGQAAITVSGTITPTPTVASNVVITTKGPMGAVDIGSTPVSMTDGTFSYTLVAGGNAAWVSGQYTVNGTWGASGNTATQTTTFAYTANGLGGGVTTVTVTTTTTSISTTTIGVQTVTTTTTIPSSDAAALTSIQGSLTTITATLGTITGTLNTISQAVTQLNTAFTGISGNISTLNNIGGQLTTLTNSVNNNQTYVLVVAALAAITLVLELAILVRKLS